MGFDFSGMEACSTVSGSKTRDTDLVMFIPKQASMMQPQISFLNQTKLKQPTRIHNNPTKKGPKQIQCTHTKSQPLWEVL